MTREQVKEQFPDATEEQITAILNINGAYVTQAKKNNVDPKELKRLQGIEAEYTKLQDAGLTDAEKAARALADAEAAKVEFAKKSNRLDAEKILVAAGLTEDDYKDLIDGIISDDAEKTKSMATGLATMVTKQKESAIQKTKEELMDRTPNPAGGSGGGEEKTEDVKFAEEVAGTFSTASATSKSVFDNYEGGRETRFTQKEYGQPIEILKFNDFKGEA